MPQHDVPRLSTGQVAARLGVKPETVYAYVSRGLLTRRPAADPRASTFDPLEVEALAARSARRPPSTAGTGKPLLVMDSALTVIEDDELYFRGMDAVELSAAVSFERAAHWLWTGNNDPAAGFDDDPRLLQLIASSATVIDPLPRLDRLRLVAVLAAAADPGRHRLDQDSVTAAAGALLQGYLAALHGTSGNCCAGTGFASRLWCALSGRPPGAGERSLTEAILVLAMDHDLAMSTLAVRAAASARSNPYAAVGAGLAAFDGPVHGGASIAAHRLVTLARDRGAAPAVGQTLHQARHLAGFGHLTYRGADPRAIALLRMMRGLPQFAPATAAADALVELVGDRLGLQPNLDLALAVTTVAADLPADTGQLLFAVARTAGWIAHALEEYAAPAGRLRPATRYTGNPPGSVAW